MNTIKMFLLFSVVGVFSIENKVFYDKFGTRYHLINESQGSYNFLFVPGGPGADSVYLYDLASKLNLPGKKWLIDFNQNGNNTICETESFYDFDKWFDSFFPMIKSFENPVYVGHSFGGIIPLMFTDLEDLLKGLILISSSPRMDNSVGDSLARANGIFISKDSFLKFIENPNDYNFKNALISSAPKHFPEPFLKNGIEFFVNLPFNFKATLWIMNKVDYINNKLTWVPQSVPTLIIGGDKDYINPISMFLNDSRFYRSNISFKVIENAGHFPFLEKMDDVLDVIDVFILKNFMR